MPLYPIKVLIADDSFFMRKLLRALLAADEDIEVVGEAKDGKEVVALSQRLHPDVITMDYNMPCQTGAQAVGQIVKSQSKPPLIIMVSAFTKEGAKETIECLAAGAADFIAKPTGEVSLNIEQIGPALIEKIKALRKARLFGSSGEKQEKTRGVRKSTVRASRVATKCHPQVVVIGASTGGPQVVEELLEQMPAKLKPLVIVVQHMPALFTTGFAERLNRRTGFEVSEARQGMEVHQGMCLVAPGSIHMYLKKRGDRVIVRLSPEPKKNQLHPSIDELMGSVAEVFGSRVLGVILTGMGDDGSIGARKIKAAGGKIFAQDPETAVIKSMPESVIMGGLADDVFDLDDLATELKEIVL